MARLFIADQKDYEINRNLVLSGYSYERCLVLLGQPVERSAAGNLYLSSAETEKFGQLTAMGFTDED